MNISRPPEHRWKPTHYTHTANPPYKLPTNLCQLFRDAGKAFRRFGASLGRAFGGDDHE